MSLASCWQRVIRSRHAPDHQHCLPSPTVNLVGLLTAPSASASSWRYSLITRATGADASARRGNSAAAVSWGGTGLIVRGRLVLAEGLGGAACIAGRRKGQCSVICSLMSAQTATDRLTCMQVWWLHGAKHPPFHHVPRHPSLPPLLHTAAASSAAPGAHPAAACSGCALRAGWAGWIDPAVHTPRTPLSPARTGMCWEVR